LYEYLLLFTKGFHPPEKLMYLQQKQGYQAPQKLPMCENNHNWQNLALMGVSGARLT